MLIIFKTFFFENYRQEKRGIIQFKRSHGSAGRHQGKSDFQLSFSQKQSPYLLSRFCISRHTAELQNLQCRQLSTRYGRALLYQTMFNIRFLVNFTFKNYIQTIFKFTQIYLVFFQIYSIFINLELFLIQNVNGHQSLVFDQKKFDQFWVDRRRAFDEQSFRFSVHR